MPNHMFKASFKVAEIDMSEDPKTGQRTKLKKFESVSRLKAHAVNSKHKSPCDVILDFNSDIYVINEGDRLAVALADEEHGEALADDYEYVMHGRLYKYGEADGLGIVFASFGGLMMQLKVDPAVLSPEAFNINDSIYILIKRER